MLKKFLIFLLLLTALALAAFSARLYFGAEKSPAAKGALYALVPMGQADYVAVFNANTFELVKRISTPGNCHSARATKSGKYVFVSCRDADKLYIIDTAKWKVVREIPVGDKPHHAASARDKYIYTANMNSGDVSVVEIPSWKAVKAIKIGEGATPSQLAVSPDGRYVYVVTGTTSEIVKIDTSLNEIAARFVVPADSPTGFRDVEVSPDGKVVYVSSEPLDKVFGVDSSTGEVAVEIAVDIGDRPRGLDIGKDGRILYLGNIGTDDFSVIDIASKKIIKRIPASERPLCGVKVTPDGKYVWMTTGNGNDIFIADTATNKIIKTIHIEEAPGEKADPHEVNFVSVPR